MCDFKKINSVILENIEDLKTYETSESSGSNYYQQ